MLTRARRLTSYFIYCHQPALYHLEKGQKIAGLLVDNSSIPLIMLGQLSLASLQDR